MTLLEKQRLFCYLIAELIRWCYDEGYELTFGDAFRSREAAAANAATGSGIVNSLHTIRLAVDLNLFINGIYQTDSKAYTPLGQHWKSLHPLNRWGGDFHSRKDGNHFSMEHNGVK